MKAAEVGSPSFEPCNDAEASTHLTCSTDEGCACKEFSLPSNELQEGIATKSRRTNKGPN